MGESSSVERGGLEGSPDGVQTPNDETYAYLASKAAVHPLSRVIAKRLAPNVTVNAVAPGPFESSLMAATLEQFRDAIIPSVPMGRIGDSEDMAGMPTDRTSGRRLIFAVVSLQLMLEWCLPCAADVA